MNPPPTTSQTNTSNPRSPSPEPIYLCGPTASGKSALALALAAELRAEIVNADPFQAYQGLAHITAAPSLTERAQCPHHLYETLDPAEPLDAASFRELALPVIREIQARGRIPLIVGGSGLYLKFLTHGPAQLPPSDAKLRQKLETLPTSTLVAELQQHDPAELERLGPHNRRYLIRALEIIHLTGKPASAQRQNWTHTPPGLRGLLIQWPRTLLRQRISERTPSLLTPPSLEEVARLPQGATTATKAIGVRQIRALLRNEISHSQCLQDITTATHQLAKRQETWFRKEHWLTPLPMGSHDHQQPSTTAYTTAIKALQLAAKHHQGQQDPETPST